MTIRLLRTLPLLAWLCCALNPNVCSEPLKKLRYSLVQTEPHAIDSFTQGLIVSGDNIVESSGLFNRSFIRIYNKQSNAVVRENRIPDQFFAEGITAVNNELYLLTWQAGLLLIVDPYTLATRKTVPYSGQGWGITYDGKNLFTSDGSHRIAVRTPKTFKTINTLSIIHPETLQKLDRLNELEYAHDKLWANRWMTNMIYAINPHDGAVIGELDLTRLVPYVVRKDKQRVLNGIAYDTKADAYWVTGKQWPVRYLIRIE